MTVGIYVIKNKVNDKCYVGQSVNIESRFNDHVWHLKNQKHKNILLQRAFAKYGLDNLEFIRLEECEVNELDEREKFYIEKYDSYRNGYNLTKGGDGTLGRIIKHSTKKKISESLKGKKRSEEIKKKFSLIQKQLWTNPEYKLKMKTIPRKKGEEANKSMKVICINDQKVFGSLTLAGEYYGIGLKKVSSVCTGKCEYTGLEEVGRKLEFAYYEEGKTYTLKNIKHNNEKKKVCCLTTGDVFNSMSEAGEKMNAPSASISHVCNGRRKHAGKLPDGTKLKWAFLE